MKTYKSNIDKIKLVKEKTNFKKAKISRSQDGADYARQFYFDDLEIYESVFLLLLNNANNTIGYVKISQGGTAQSIADIKLICKYAVETLSRSIILVHNHPSGTLNPSTDDKKITDKLKTALSFLDIRFLDHIILTADSFYSFADNGLI